MRVLSIVTYTTSIGLALSLLTSCAPTATTLTTLRLEPVSGDVAMIDGRPVTKAEQNGVGVVASFEREDMEFVTLDVEIKNRTDHSIEVNPADFRFVALGAEQDTLTDTNTGQTTTRQAADPTYEAARVGQKRTLEVKRLKRAKIVNTVLLVAAIASDASSAGRSRSYGEYVSNRIGHDLAYQGIMAKRVIDRSTFANRMQQYDYEEYRWHQLALKASTLAPGESVRGFVYLPKVAKADYLAINYLVPEQASVPLVFRQNRVPVTPGRLRR